MYELMGHQKKGLEFLAGKKGAGLFFQMRLGKTRTLLEHFKNLHAEGSRPFPTLIICPLSVVSVWSSEIKKFGYGFKTVHVTGTRQQRLKALETEADIYIINYEGVRIIVKDLAAKNFRTIATDESHRHKASTAQQTRCILQLGYNAEYRFIMTGTPVTKSPEDIWAQIQFIQPGYLGNFYAFRSRYIEFRKMRVRSKDGMREVQVAYRFKNLKELEDRINKVCLRMTQAECFDLPEMSYKTILCPMEGDQAKAYYRMKHSLSAELEGGTMTIQTALTQVSKMQQICHGFLYDEEGVPNWLVDNSKIKMLKDLLEDIVSEKIVLFCNFKCDLELLSAKLSEWGMAFVRYGGTAEERALCVEKFTASQEPMVFLSTIETGKEGINLSAACHVVYYGRNYNYASRYQSEARIQSAFQKRNLIYYDLVCPNTIDEKVLEVLQMKGDLADKVLGDSMRLAMLAADKETI